MGIIVIAVPKIMSLLRFNFAVEIPAERKAAKPMTRVVLIMFEPKVTAMMISLFLLTAEDMDIKSSGILVATARRIKAMLNSDTLKERAALDKYLTVRRPKIIRAAREVIRMTKLVVIGSIVAC